MVTMGIREGRKTRRYFSLRPRTGNINYMLQSKLGNKFVLLTTRKTMTELSSILSSLQPLEKLAKPTF